MQQLNGLPWRELLAHILRDPGLKQRLIEQLHVSSATLMRWSKGRPAGTNPKPIDLVRMVEALPEFRQELVSAIRLDPLFTDFLQAGPAEPSEVLEQAQIVEIQIPSHVYAKVLEARTKGLHPLWPMCYEIFPSLQAQLDPQRRGLEVVLSICMPPSTEGKVRSLRVDVGLGTAPPWSGIVEKKNQFLGAESLAGYAVTKGYPVWIQNVDDDQSLLPSHRMPHERSSAAFPITSSRGKVAGCLTVASTQVHFFTHPRLELLRLYTDLLNTAFDREEFIPLEALALGVMPSWQVQQEAFSSLRRRIDEVQMEAQRHQERIISGQQAEEQVLRELEERLLTWQAQTHEDDPRVAAGEG